MIYPSGSTSQSIDIFIGDDLGIAVTGLVASTMPTVKYSRAGANADVTITLADLSLITTVWASGGFKERGNGVYRLDVPDAAFTTSGEVTIRGEASGKHVFAPRLEIGVLDNIEDQTDRLGSGLVTIITAVASDGSTTIFIGCDYSNTDSTALDFTDASNLWPTLTSAAISFKLYQSDEETLVFSKAGSVVTGTGTGKKVRVELTAAETATIPVGVHHFRILATLSGGHVAPPLVRGNCAVKNP